MSEYMADISSLLGANSAVAPKNSTSRKNNTNLDMQDFLQLMVTQLTSQTLDDTMDTSEMMNQLVQMQMITAITNLTESSVMSYASSLVGKTVTVGIVDGNTLEEREIEVMGTGTYDGKQVIFGSDGEMYQLSQIMAVGRLPDEDGNYTVPVNGGNNNNTVENPEGASGTTGTGDGNTGNVDGTGGAGETGDSSENTEYDGQQGAPTD